MTVKIGVASNRVHASAKHAQRSISDFDKGFVEYIIRQGTLVLKALSALGQMEFENKTITLEEIEIQGIPTETQRYIFEIEASTYALLEEVATLRDQWTPEIVLHMLFKLHTMMQYIPPKRFN